MYKGKKSYGDRNGSKKKLRGNKGKSKGDSIWYVGGKKF